MKLLTTLMLSFLLTACSVFGDRDGTEETPFKVFEKIADDFEIRDYPIRLAAQIIMPPSQSSNGKKEDQGSDAFRALFDYIQGANKGSQKVAMTVPVETAKPSQKIEMTVPVQQNEGSGSAMMMRFFLPSALTPETAPVPEDPRVEVIPVPGQRLAVVTFSGLGWDSSVRTEKRLLLKRVKRAGWKAVGEPFAYFYDPPWTLPFFRRNEVAVPVVKAD